MKRTQVLIIGGGLAGLTAAIHLSAQNIPVVLVERSKYPRHKVCGEYLSKEILPYLEYLGIDLYSLGAKEINRFRFSTSSGKFINTNLKMGGLGISRYKLDAYLYSLASETCETIHDTIIECNYTGNEFTVTGTNGLKIKADIILGAFGKRSNMDKYLNRQFIDTTSGWLGIKAHYSAKDFPSDLVALHNFKGGYCGLSMTETNAINVCYLTSYKSFKEHKNTIDFQQHVLKMNPRLKDFFENAAPLFKKEISIAQISFDKKQAIENHVLMLGDAAGLIHPLSGNGMAMAIHSSKIASECIIKYYHKASYDRNDLENEYMFLWKQTFSRRMQYGRILQKILLNPGLNDLVPRFIQKCPGLLPVIIKKTHGKYVYP